MAGYICLITSLGQEQLSAANALELYRFRWQIELAFKRLKSLLALGDLPAKDPALVHTIIYAKLLAALILDDYTGRYLSFFPWGYRMAKQPPVFMAH
jgi:IS4 transposase